MSAPGAEGAPGLVDLGGGTSVAYVEDGLGALLPAVFLPTVPPGVLDDLLDATGEVPVGLGGFLVRTPSHTVLVDAGCGPGPVVGGSAMTRRGLGAFRGGALVDGLATAGVRPDDVDAVVVTHLHFDHVGWLLDEDGSLVFPRARHLVPRAEWEHGTAHPDAHGHLTPGGFFDPLRSAVELVDPGDEPLPGLTCVDTRGHTAGHTAYAVAGTERRVVVVGDVAHVPYELEHPEHGCVRDADPAAATAARRLLAELCRDPDVIVAAGHFTPNPFGRLEASDRGLVWRPLEA